MKKVAIITGASGGLGHALSLRFTEGGFAVAVHYYQNKKAADELVSMVRSNGGEAGLFYCDVRSSGDVTSMIDMIAERWGNIDVLINNAAISIDNLLIRTDQAEWENIIATNLTGSFYTIRAVSKYMMKKKKGHIINISSLVGLKGHAGQCAYSSAKAGLIGLTKSTALELGRFNIYVNAILPGFMKTAMTESIPEQDRDSIINSNALMMSQDISEVAEFVYHLSNMTRISGQVFNTDSRIL
ncbi:MAG: SDR family NAD(P)-dependent oxidoreductase [Nitrospirae bacterium]|nr:SDR family NAD(P)-dependent oxidoreductase [Nitrospirota bacterium]